ncbi:hypothetical protein NKZ05_17860 [Stutzerimonas stutzeri]|uniref:hypothetical protein n=1 Tax=Stutzerimonas stutzeri TaxID=316 RepID=UPI00387DC2EF
MCFRILLIALIAVLAGCVDFKSGSHWRTESNGWKTQPKPYYAFEWISYQCNSSPLTVATSGFNESSIATFFLFPIASLGKATYPETLRVFAISENLKNHCSPPTKDLFKVKVNGRTNTNYTIAQTLKAESCLIGIMESPETIGSFEIQANEELLKCDINPLKVYRNVHYCLRGTRFGGSESCGY